MRAEKILQDRLFAHPHVKVLWDQKAESFIGSAGKGLTGVKLVDTVSTAESVLETDGAFVAIDHAPATELFKGKLELDESGYIVVQPGTPRTAIPGVFACGDVMGHTYRQARHRSGHWLHGCARRRALPGRTGL